LREKECNVYNISLLTCQIKNPTAKIKRRPLIKRESHVDKRLVKRRDLDLYAGWTVNDALGQIGAG